MDPAFVSNQIWHDISILLRLFWVYVFLIVGFVVNLLIAHAIIPSLAASGQLPGQISRLRPLFYLGALSILVVALAFFVLAMREIGVLGQVLDRWWI